LRLTDRDAFDPTAAAVTIAVALRTLFGDDFETENLDALLVHRRTAEAIRRGDSLEEIISDAASAVAGYQRIAKRYWLYPE